MEVLDWQAASKIDEKYSPSAVSIGVFDGVHIGHQALIKEIKKKASSMVITFRNNPKTVLHNPLYDGDITTFDQKIDLLSRFGVTVTIIIDFSTEFSKLSSEDFFIRINKFADVQELVIGKDFRCGRNGESTASDLKKWIGKYYENLRIMDPITFQGREISSSRIRQKLISGDLWQVNSMLGRTFEIIIPTCITKYTSAGLVQIPKNYFLQILPETGIYSVELVKQNGSFEETKADLNGDSVCYVNKKNVEVKSLRFTERLY